MGSIAANLTDMPSLLMWKIWCSKSRRVSHLMKDVTLNRPTRRHGCGDVLNLLQPPCFRGGEYSLLFYRFNFCRYLLSRGIAVGHPQVRSGLAGEALNAFF